MSHRPGLRGIAPEVGRYDFDTSTVVVTTSSSADFGIHSFERFHDKASVRAEPLFEDQKTFGLGIYRYEEGKRGIKRGKVVKRIRGNFSKPEEAFREADRVCREMEGQR